MISSRIRELLSQMSPQEKLGQLQIVYRPRHEEAAALVRAGIGAVFWPQSAAASNALQREAVEGTRLGIPILIGLDVIHGQRTIAPVPLAQAASFDPDMVERLARTAAVEARSGGVTWTFSPMIDVSRDPRWGRVVEGFGEDVHVTSVMGNAMVRGYQEQDLSRPGTLAATAKHFVAYGQPDGGRDYNSVDMSAQRLRNVYLEPFRAAVRADVAAVMASFNTVAGVPMHANGALLTGILKDEWGFDGLVVGDADGVANLVPHRVAETIDDAVRMAYAAGVDVEMGGAPSAIAWDASTLDPARLDDAVARVLGVKEALGLFERPYVDEAAERVEPTDATRAQARRAAARSAVLLQNDGTLPLSTGSRVLLTGPYATSTDHLGAWAQSFSARSSSIADALRARDDIEVIVEEGVSFFGDRHDDVDAVATAALEADVVVVCVGEPSSLSGEAASRSDLRLPGRQADLIRAIAGTGIPFVVVLANGRPLVVADWIDEAPAVLEVWHGGTEAPAAIVDLLLGDQEPAGRLPMSFPRSAGQVPVHYAHENTGRPAAVRGTMTLESVDVALEGPANVQEKYTSKYLDLDLGPQFSFGHGSGYATFSYGQPRVSSAEIAADEAVTLEVEVTNTSARAGDEVVQVYVEDVVASIAPPVRRLVAFRRRTFAAGETATLSFEIGPEQLGFWLADGRFAVEPGAFVMHVGGALERTVPVRLQVR
ncbi:glycoside hydrolase family 3 N-terminal domain-containing protein [Microbacterium sp. RU33B]|uniref:glycoside hydrolase family 3 N-terminal domain-containing protein n=1 Tax=Microbacterium sp. RU33B TaxID=1907390 RepID=UPI0009692747|nr:glycoside hydrolase family 3 N-terminal domain-containing protein [Microbacterium sp. RU33B]SIT67301.1 beta-glucosidase [Microbacterium sp. RU33B]